MYFGIMPLGSFSYMVDLENKKGRVFFLKRIANLEKTKDEIVGIEENPEQNDESDVVAKNVIVLPFDIEILKGFFDKTFFYLREKEETDGIEFLVTFSLKKRWKRTNTIHIETELITCDENPTNEFVEKTLKSIFSRFSDKHIISIDIMFPVSELKKKLRMKQVLR